MRLRVRVMRLRVRVGIVQVAEKGINQRFRFHSYFNSGHVGFLSGDALPIPPTWTFKKKRKKKLNLIQIKCKDFLV